MSLKTISWPTFYCVFLISITLFSCSEREPIEIIKEYEVGFRNDQMIRTYYYMRIPENDTLMIRFTPSVENGIQYVTEYSYTQKERYSERRFRIEGTMKEMVRQINYHYPDIGEPITIEAQIVDYKIVESGKYNGGNYSITVRLPNNIVTNARVIETFDKDTVYNWQGEMLPALKFKEATTYNTHHRFIPFVASSKTEGKGYVLFAKDVGLVYYEIKTPNYFGAFRLLSLNISPL